MAAGIRNNRNIRFIDVAVALYLGCIFFADGTTLFRAITVVFYIAGALYVLQKRKMKLSLYCLFIGLFVLYNCATTYLGGSLFPEASKHRLQSVALNYLSCLIIFQYALKKSNREKIVRFSAGLAITLVFYILLFNSRSVLSMRFGTGTPYLFGMKGTSGEAFNSNAIAGALNMAYAFCVLMIWERSNNGLERTGKSNKQLYAATGFFSVFILLTGSRKGLLTLLVFIFFYVMLKSGTLEKRIKGILLTAVLAIAAYFLIMRVEVLYNIIGSRMEVLIKGLLDDEGFQNRSSAFFRSNMISYGMDFFRQRPLIGWGLDSYSQMSVYSTYSHNNFVELLVSDGILGFAVYYGALAYNLIAARKFIKASDPGVRKECIILLSYAIASLLMHIAHVVYLNRLSLMCDFLFAAAITDWKTQTRHH